MNRIIRSTIRFFVKQDFLWILIKPVIKLTDYVRCQRQLVVSGQLMKDRQIIELLKEAVVKNGPFTGLIYPGFIYHNSRFFSHIIGSYEYEISELIEKLCHQNFQQIINIGCGDGYYAVGFAKRIPSVTVLAYDSSNRARKHCLKMALLNGVSKRVLIGGTFYSSTLAGLNISGRQFILCDCEGEEKAIFTESNLILFRNCELLIEVHDFIDITIGDYLRKIFANTHDLKIFNSTDDLSKAKNYHYELTDSLDLEMRKIVFEECRPAPMEWYYFTPKTPVFMKQV